eukprot:g96.t1
MSLRSRTSNRKGGNDGHFQDTLREADDLVKEYLVFRGFTDTLVTLGNEQKGHKHLAFNAKNIVDRLFDLVKNGDADGLMKCWRFMDVRFFENLEDEQSWDAAKSFKVCLKKYFIAMCIKSGANEKALAFLKKECQRRHAVGSDEGTWREWYALPFIEDPASDARCGMYFNSTWINRFRDSLTNFLTSVFRRLPLPNIMNFRTLRLDTQRMATELEAARAEIRRLERRLRLNDAELHSLRRNEHFANDVFPDRDTKKFASDSSTERPFSVGWSHCLARHADAVTCCDTLISDRDVLLLSGSNDATAQLWRLCNSSTRVSDYEGEDKWSDLDAEDFESIDALELSNGRRLERLHDFSLPEELPRVSELDWRGRNSTGFAAALCPEINIASEGSSFRGADDFGKLRPTVAIWDAVRPKEALGSYKLLGGTETISALKFEDQLVVVGCADGMIRILDSKSGRWIWQKRAFDEHGVQGIAYVASSNALLLTNGTGVVEKWDLRMRGATVQIGDDAKHVSSKIERPVSASVLSESNQLLSPTAQKTSIVVGGIPPSSASAESGGGLERYCLVGSNHGVTSLFNAAVPDAPICSLRGHVGAVLSLSWIPQRQLAVTASADGTVRLWNLYHKKK